MAVGLRLTIGEGRTLGYAEYGDRQGRPLVYLHGFPGSRLAGRLLDESARIAGVRVLAPERPGLGFAVEEDKRDANRLRLERPRPEKQS